MASKEEIQKQNIEDANVALGEQLSLVAQLNDKMVDLTKTLKEKGTLDKLSATAVKEVVTATKNLKSEYDSVKSVQKDIAKNEELTNKLIKQGNALKVEGGKKLEDEVKMLKTRESSLTKAENKLAKMNQSKSLGKKIDEDLLAQAEATVLKKQTQLDITLESLSAEAEQLVYVEQAEQANAANAAHLADQLTRQQNIEKAGGRMVKNSAALGNIFNKLGMSGVGKVFTNASESIKKMAYEATDGGKKSIGMFAKMKIAAKGFGMALKVALGPIALLGMAVSLFGKMKQKAKEAASAIRATGQASVDMGRELGLSASKTEEVAGQISKVSAGMGMTTIQAKAAGGAIYSAMDGAEKLTNKTLKSFMKLQKFAKMSGDDLKQIKNLSKLSGQEASKVADAMADTAKHSIKSLKLNTSMKSIMTAVGKVSNNVKLAMGGSAVGITKAVAQAKKLGLEMSQVEGIASSLLNIEDSMQAEMEAELLTGKELNLEKARAAALNGDNVGLMNELSKQGITAADYSEMNVIQQEALAKSLGMNRGQMADMLVTQKENVAENTDMVDMQKQGIEAMTGLVSAMESKAALDEAAALANAEAGSAYIKFEEAITRLGIALAPLIEEVFPVMLDFVTYIVEGVTDIITKFTEGGSIMDTFNNKLTGTQKWVTGIAAAFVGIVATLKIYRGIMIAINGAKKIAAGFDRASRLYTLFKHNMGKKELVQMAAKKAAMVGQKALEAASFVKSVGIAAMRAISSLSAIPVVGIGLGLAAAAVVAGMAAKYMNDGVQGPVGGGGYSRTMYGPEGAISFNDKDTIVAGTNLGGSGGNSGGGNNSAELGRIASLLEQLLNKEGGVYIDGNKVGGTIALTNYQQQ